MNNLTPITKFILLITFGLVLTSCLNNPNGIEETDELLLSLKLNNVNEAVIADSDTLSINLIRFLIGTSFLHNGDGDTLLINRNVYQLNHASSGGLDQEVKGLAQGTFNTGIIYNTLNFEIKKAEITYLNNHDIDDAFTQGESEDQLFSMIINGTYNSQSFEFKSTRNFNYELPFQNFADGTTGNLRYNLNMQTDIESWFQNPGEEGLLNPSEPSNASLINDNIESSISLN